MVFDVLFSSKSDDWSTPIDFYTKLNNEFNFNFDPCPLKSSINGLNISWNGNVFINPPYSNIEQFIKKGFYEFATGRSKTLVYLIPARTDTKWFHTYIYMNPLVEIRFIKGRLKFGNSKNSAPFPSMLIILKQ